MATIANYPDGIGTAGPTIDKVMKAPVEYKTTTFKMEGGGAVVNITPCGMLRWTLEYDGLSEAEVVTLRTHYNLAKGATNDFSFYDRNDAATYAGCRYKSWKSGKHIKKWSNVITVEIERFA